MIIVDKDLRIKERVRNFMKLMSKMMRSWMTLQSKYNHYFTMMYISMPINTQMHTLIKCEIPDGQSSDHKNHFKAVCKSCSDSRHDHSRQRPKNKGKGKKFHEINEQNDEVMDDLAEQVQSLVYNDVHFNAINTQMHTLIKCEIPDGQSSDHTFKIDTGDDGNLMPISMFSRLFPQVGLDALSRTIEKDVTLYTYNNSPIKQYGTCHVKLSFKSRSSICKFFCC